MLALRTVRRASLLAIAVLTVLNVGVLVAGLILNGLGGTSALFTSTQPVNAALGAARIFSDERVTTGFAVGDHSSGSAVDGSSTTAFGSDGRYFLTRTWPTSFATDRYVDLDFNAPLPAGLTAQSVALNLRLASDAGTGSVCIYVEARRASTGSLLSSHGSSGSPLACTSGATYSTVNVTLTSVDATDLANDVRVRIFARDSAASAIRLDEATVAGSTPYSTFTLYPVQTSELYSGQTELIRWGLAGP